MATLLPPPKRRKLYHGVPEPQVKPAPPIPSVVVQFVNEEDGEPIAPAVTLPADLTREQLETLVNKLSTSVSRHNPTLKKKSDLGCRMSQYRSLSTSLYQGNQRVRKDLRQPRRHE